ncbi:hypothetical protein [Nocardia pseudovaccinii]|uniref:hypothetical protein n=1 Tax=Nocardia pseudovaccinii TaxID=189540 RepID=UPI0007A44905|nr:hypothetical protein [Nocardia pseudovaccinii]
MNQTATEPFGKSVAIIVDEWWIPAGQWAEVAVYDPLRGAALLRALDREAAARLDYIRDENTAAADIPPLVVCIDDMASLAGEWHRIAEQGDRHDRRQLAVADPKAALHALIGRAPDAGVTVLSTVPTAPLPQHLREMFSTRVNLADPPQDGAQLLWNTPDTEADDAPGRGLARAADSSPASVSTRGTPPSVQVIPSLRRVPVWRTPGAPTRTLLAYPLASDERSALYSAELHDFVENL